MCTAWEDALFRLIWTEPVSTQARNGSKHRNGRRLGGLWLPPDPRFAPSCFQVPQAMFLTALFVLLTATLASAGFGSRRVTVGLAGLSFVFAIGVYFHHASDALPLSF